VVALALWQMVRILSWQGHLPDHLWLALGITVGVALLTKTLAWITLPLALLTLLMRWRQERKRYAPSPGAALRPLLNGTLRVGVIALLLIMPWFARNTLTYGAWDVMGLQRHDEIAVGQPRTEEEVARRGLLATIQNGVETTFNSFWGQFGWMKAPLQEWEYRVLWAFHVVALAGWGVLVLRRLRHPGTPAIRAEILILFGAGVLVNVALLLFYNLEFVQYQGRYLFSSLIPLAFFLMAGLGAVVPLRWRFIPRIAFVALLLWLDALAILERLPGMMSY
jgi:hypothetical protein